MQKINKFKVVLCIVVSVLSIFTIVFCTYKRINKKVYIPAPLYPVNMNINELHESIHYVGRPAMK